MNIGLKRFSYQLCRLCADLESFSGGFYNVQNEATQQLIGNSELFTPVSAKKRVCFLYDESKPIHCSETGCNSEPLQLSTRLTRHPEIRVHVEGWRDPIPPGGNESSVAHIYSYKLEVHDVLTDHSPLTVNVRLSVCLTGFLSVVPVRV